MGRGRKRSPDQGNHAGDLRSAFSVILGREGERDTQAHGLTRDGVWRRLSEKLSFKWHFRSKSEAPAAVPFCDEGILSSQLPARTIRRLCPGSSSLGVIFDSLCPCSAGERASPTPVQRRMGSLVWGMEDVGGVTQLERGLLLGKSLSDHTPCRWGRVSVGSCGTQADTRASEGHSRHAKPSSSLSLLFLITHSGENSSVLQVFRATQRARAVFISLVPVSPSGTSSDSHHNHLCF